MKKWFPALLFSLCVSGESSAWNNIVFYSLGDVNSYQGGNVVITQRPQFITSWRPGIATVTRNQCNGLGLLMVLGLLQGVYCVGSIPQKGYDQKWISLIY